MTTATLNATKVFSYLRPEEIDILSNYASTEQYKAGAIVYRKGQPAARAHVNACAAGLVEDRRDHRQRTAPRRII